MHHLHFLTFLVILVVPADVFAFGSVPNPDDPAGDERIVDPKEAPSPNTTPVRSELKPSEEKTGGRTPDAQATERKAPPQSQDRERTRWNRSKDIETFNTRVNGYSGRHGGGTSAAIPTVKPLVSPYVEYEFIDRNGDTWEKLGGSDEKLREYIAEHPEETFLDSDGELYGSLPMGLSISIQNSIDNSRVSNESTSNTIINNSYVDGASISLNIGGTPVNVVVNANEARLQLGEDEKAKAAEAVAQKSSESDENDSKNKITINNNISIDAEGDEGTAGTYSMAQAPESAYLWLLKKVGLRKDVKKSISTERGIASEGIAKHPAKTRMLASANEIEVSADFNWFAFAFVLTALVFATRELQRSKFRILIPVPVKRDKEKNSSRVKPSEGTRATSATRMQFKR